MVLGPWFLIWGHNDLIHVRIGPFCLNHRHDQRCVVPIWREKKSVEGFCTKFEDSFIIQ